MSDYKFKVGDRVMVTKIDTPEKNVGIRLMEMGTIRDEASFPFVELDKIHDELLELSTPFVNGRTWCFDENQLQLIERPNKDNYFDEQSAIDYLKSLGYTITKTFFLFIFVGMAVSCLDKSVIPFDSLDNCADCFNTDYCTLVEQGDETELEFGLSPLRGVSVISDFSFGLTSLKNEEDSALALLTGKIECIQL